MTAKDGPLRSNDDMSSLGNGEYRTENDRQAEGLRHEIRWFIFACAGIATLALLLLVPRWQGIVALLFGFGFRSWLSRIRETLESKFSDMSTMGIQVEAKFLPGWNYADMLLLAAGFVGLITTLLTFTRFSPQGFMTWKSFGAVIADSTLRGRAVLVSIWKWYLSRSRKLKIALPLYALVGVFVAWQGPRFVRRFFRLEETVSIPGGCIEIDTLGTDDQTGVRKLCVEAFEMDRYEGARATTERILGKTSRNFPCIDDESGKEVCQHSMPDLPSNGLSWSDADSFCRERGMRLPTSDEWEYAARSGSRSVLLCENNLKHANLGGTTWSDKHVMLAPVGSFGGNAYGLHDMFGNVAEWTTNCTDETHGDIGIDSVRRSEFGDDITCLAAGGSWHTMRKGFGGWKDFNPNEGNDETGVRCVK